MYFHQPVQAKNLNFDSYICISFILLLQFDSLMSPIKLLTSPPFRPLVRYDAFLV